MTEEPKNLKKVLEYTDVMSDGDIESKKKSEETPLVPLAKKKARWWDTLIGDDWFSCWCGFTTLFIVLIWMIVIDFHAYITPKPQNWSTNPWDSFPDEVLIGMGILFVVTFIMGFVSLRVIKKQRFWIYVPAWTIQFILAGVSLFLGRQDQMRELGLGFAFWGIMFGIIITNFCAVVGLNIDWLVMSQRAEYYLKIGLVLLAIKFQTVIKLGPPGLMMTWLVTPVILLSGYVFGVKVLKIKNKELAMMIAAGGSVCGASAATAACSAVDGTREDLTLAIVILTLFTIFYMIAMPFFAISVGIDQYVAGSWFGGCIDATGAVIAASANISPIAEEVGGLVKMIQNSMIGFLALGMAYYWQFYVKPVEGKKVSYWVLWHKFPKFVLGFFVCSFTYSFILMPIFGEKQVDIMMDLTGTVSAWWFAIAFVGIGFDSNIKKLLGQMTGGQPVIQYLFVQNLDVLVTFGAAYACFSGLLFQIPNMEQ